MLSAILAIVLVPQQLRPDDPPLSGVVAVPVHLVDPGAHDRGGARNVGANLRMNRDATSNSQNEYSIAIDPRRPDVFLAGANDYRTGPVKVGFFASHDGGRTIVNDGVMPLVAPFAEAGDPAIAYDGFGNGYVLALDFNRSPLAGALVLHRTNDGGLTFQPPHVAFQVPGNLPDKPYIAADQRTAGTFAGSLYVTFTGFGAAPTALQCIRSRDQGNTWSGPVALGSGQGTSPAVGPNGEVYVSWQTGNEIRFNRSTDGGATFAGERTIQNITANPSPLPPTIFRCNSFPSTAADGSSGPYRGRVHVCWSSRVANSSAIFAIHSDDGGITWSPAVRVDDAASGDQFFQWITVDEAGTVFACWHDRRNDPQNRAYDCYASASYDGGTTWIPNWRVSEVISDPANSGFIGDYSGIAAARGRCFPTWCDLRNGNQDAYTAPVQADLEIGAASLSSSAGGSVALPIKAGPRYAGQLYVVVANFSGTSAGTPIGAATFFLNPDPLVEVSLLLGNFAPFTMFQGLLGAGGIPPSQPRFDPPPGLIPFFVGLDLHFVYLLVDGTPAFTYGSNPVRLSITP